jgi:hypothetical protein
VIRDGRDVALSTLNVDWRALNYFLDWTPQQLRWINLRLALQRRFRNHLPLSLQELFLRAPTHAQNLRAPTILFPAANTFYNALYRWQVWNELYDRYAAELGVPQLTVRYEDLLLDQQGTFPEIFKFIGARWDDRVLNYGQYRHDLRPGDVGGSSAMRFERVAPENAYTWKMRLTRHQRRLVRARFDHYLVAAGYERTPES